MQGGPERASYCYNYAGQAVECASVVPIGNVTAPALTLLSDAALPVTLIDFQAARKEKNVFLQWSTSSETNSDHFSVERSADGKHWNEIGTVTAQGDATEEQHYSFTDGKPLAGENFYRLKMIDADSTFAYSRIRSVMFDDRDEMLLYPNPLTVNSKLIIQAPDPSKITGIGIFNAAGKQVFQSPWSAEIDLGHLPAGLYVVMIKLSNGSVSQQRIVKQ